MTLSYMDKQAMLKKIEEAGWSFPEAVFECLSPYDKSFIELEFTGLKTVSYYESRLKALGFTGMGRVLDAACGMGQWSVAIARNNMEVVGVDITPARLFISREIASEMDIHNADFHYASIDNMEKIESGSCDGVFCYGSFMFAPMDKTFAEFGRVLKAGGRLYINVNAIGWYLHLLIDRGIKKRNLRMIYTVLKMVLRTFMKKDSNIVVRKDWIEKLILKNGYKIVASGVEGDICLDPSLSVPERSYERQYYGQPGILEYLLEKI